MTSAQIAKGRLLLLKKTERDGGSWFYTGRDAWRRLSGRDPYANTWTRPVLRWRWL